MSRNGDLVPVVAIGGVIGALARWTLDTAIPRTEPSQWPWATLAINLSGSFVLGLLLVALLLRVPATLSESSRLARWSRPFLITGILGGFTTFSAYAMQVRDLVASGNVVHGLLYAVISVVGGVVAVAVGSMIARAALGGSHLSGTDTTDAVDTA